MDYGPMFLDGALTFATFALLGGMFWTCWKANDMVTLRELIAALLVSAFAIGNFKYFFGWVHSLTASDKALSKPRNQRKYGDQGWQLAIHVFATFYEFYLISTYSDWKWWTEIGTIFNKLDAPQKGALTTFYMVQVFDHVRAARANYSHCLVSGCSSAFGLRQPFLIRRTSVTPHVSRCSTPKRNNTNTVATASFLRRGIRTIL